MFHQWSVGDLCRAKYSEDGCSYDAEIISVDHAAGSCVVRYLNYGNVEEQELSSLLKMKRKTAKNLQAKLEQSDIEVISLSCV